MVSTKFGKESSRKNFNVAFGILYISLLSEMNADINLVSIPATYTQT